MFSNASVRRMREPITIVYDTSQYYRVWFRIYTANAERLTEPTVRAECDKNTIRVLFLLVYGIYIYFFFLSIAR